VVGARARRAGDGHGHAVLQGGDGGGRGHRGADADRVPGRLDAGSGGRVVEVERRLLGACQRAGVVGVGVEVGGERPVVDAAGLVEADAGDLDAALVARVGAADDGQVVGQVGHARAVVHVDRGGVVAGPV